MLNRDPKAVVQKIPWHNYGRVVALQVQKDNLFGPAAEFTTAARLEEHLLARAPDPKRRSLYILEGIGPGFVGALGGYFHIHPSVFLDHERVIVMSNKPDGESDGIHMPSMLQTREHITFKYFEPLQFSEPPTSFRLVCGDTGRHIGISRSNDGYFDVGIARRKATCWRRQTEEGGWDCKIVFPFSHSGNRKTDT